MDAELLTESSAPTESRTNFRTPEVTREYLRSLKEVSLGGAMESNRFSPAEIDRMLDLAKQNPELVLKLINDTKLDYSGVSGGKPVTRFSADEITELVALFNENPILFERLVNDNLIKGENGIDKRFDFEDISSLINASKTNSKLVDLLLDKITYDKNGKPVYDLTAPEIVKIVENAGSDKAVAKKVQSFINRKISSWRLTENTKKDSVNKAIEEVRQGIPGISRKPLTTVQNNFFNTLLDITKNSPILIDMFRSEEFNKAIRELKPENYSKVLSFVEKFPNSVDDLDSIINKLNTGDSTELAKFMMDSSYLEELKRNTAGKYQNELVEMFLPENMQSEIILKVLNSNLTKEDFLNGLKKMSKSTFKLAYERPNQYLSDIDTKYTNPVNGKLPELSPEVLAGQRELVKEFFLENFDELSRILKYVDTDTVSHMMDRRTELFKEDMKKLNKISDENYGLLSSMLQCKSFESGKQLSPREKIQLTQIMYIFDVTKMDTGILQDAVQKGEINISSIKNTIKDEVLRAAGIDPNDDSIPAEKKNFNPEFMYLALMDKSAGIEAKVKEQAEALRPQFDTYITSLRTNQALLDQEIISEQDNLRMIPETMPIRKEAEKLLSMFQNIESYTNEEIMEQMFMTVAKSIEYSQSATKRDDLLTVINAAVTGDFKSFITDPSNKYGKANNNTAQIFKQNGLDYNQWLNPSIEDIKLNVAGKDMSIRMWDRNPQEDLFMGNKTTCCTAIGTGINSAGTPLYLLNTSFNVVMLHDANGNVVGMSRVFMSNVDGKPSVIMDNIELNKTYIKGMTETEKGQIRDGFFDYMNKYATQVTGDNNSQVYFYSGDIHVPERDLKRAVKTVDFIGDFSDDKVYINSNHTSWVDPKDLGNVNNILWLIVPRK